ncbi:dihydrofolate reductase family protein [Amycolatopsis acidicola]|uniref:Dihydrofolate reductase family protein n=1 Tax=Amycolatopsis acidicola TaxID=2596893 RepID=A0A5N0V7W9_9PSEU|nr:dihydrofolate reductase family protein [Amycolatopsis acidicola]KAA9161568.1 dihydrofolate reductase family protein [Amycolatopsis acidicola]
MGKVRADISVSVDGYVAGPRQTRENPLGEGGEGLHEWAVALEVFRERHGEEGGVVNASDQVMREAVAGVGAGIMGRGMFAGTGPWDETWTGWWGENPPFHVPTFVLTHHRREPLTVSDTTFVFVGDGIDAACAQARKAAGDKDILIHGGARTIDQALAAGLVDELDLHVVPVVLGGGSRLLADVPPQLTFEQVRVIEAPGVTHLKYRVK